MLLAFLFSYKKYSFKIKSTEEIHKKEMMCKDKEMIHNLILIKEMQTDTLFYLPNCQKFKSLINSTFGASVENRHLLTCGCINRYNLFGKKAHSVCQNDISYSIRLQL